MSIFVNPNEVFEVKIKFNYVYNDKDECTGVKILSDKYSEEDAVELICTAAGRDFYNMSIAKEEALIINAISGKPMMISRVLYGLIIFKFFRTWNIEDDKGEPVPITMENIHKMHYLLVRELARKWLRETSGKKFNSE